MTNFPAVHRQYGPDPDFDPVLSRAAEGGADDTQAEPPVPAPTAARRLVPQLPLVGFG